MKKWNDLPDRSKEQLLDALATSMTCLSAWMDGVLSTPADSEDRTLLGEYRSAFKVYIFFMQWISKLCVREALSTSTSVSAVNAAATKGRRKKADGQWNWPEQCGKLVQSVARAMTLDMWAVFRPSKPDDALLVALVQFSTNCLSLASCVKKEENVAHASQILGRIALKYQKIDAVSAALVDLLNQFEHTASVVADIVTYSVSEFDDARLVRVHSSTLANI